MNPLLGVLIVIALAIIVYRLFRVVERILYRYIKKTMPVHPMTTRTYTLTAQVQPDWVNRAKRRADMQLDAVTEYDMLEEAERNID